jgi:glycosyltransferase involved in cell wall biosynthesis
MQTQAIRVLHLIKSLGRGGAETLLSETLKVHNKSSFVFYCIYFLPWKDQLVEEINTAGGIVQNIPAKNNIKILLQAFKISMFIKRNNIQVVHCHLPWAGFVCRIVHLISGIPVIYTEHNKQERYHFLTRFFNKFSFNLQSTAIAVSDNVAQSIKLNINPSIKVNTILNGINTEKFRRNLPVGQKIRADLGISSDAIVIGSLGVFRSQKRLDHWLEIFAIVSNCNPNVRGILVGDGPLKLDVIHQIKAMGLADIVFLPGIKTNPVEWYSSMDIFMMSSEFEGLPLALLEAMSCECAVVATNAGGISEVVNDGINGSIVDVDQWPELSSKIQFLLDNPSKRISMGQAARARVVNHFSILQMTKQLENLYTSYANTRKH